MPLTKQILSLLLLINFGGLLLGQENQPRFDYDQRIELAKAMLAPIREMAIADRESKERLHYFTRHWAAIDPAWTAKFILESPVPDDGIIYDNKALRILMSRPNEIDEADLIELLKQSKYFTFYQYALLAIEALPAEKGELRQRIIELATERELPEGKGLWTFVSRIEIARLAKDPAALDAVNKAIALFYSSGKAKDHWDAVLERPSRDKGWASHVRSQLVRFAPDSMKGNFRTEGEDSVPDQYDLSLNRILNDPSFVDQERVAQLRNIKRFSFDGNLAQAVGISSQLGLVALVDQELAFQWLESAPSEIVAVWGKLNIAAAIAKKDNAKATKMVEECYLELGRIDPSDRNQDNYNFPASLVGAAGLPIVEAVDARLIPSCIEQMIASAEPLLTSRNSSAREQYFRTIAGIARYDRGRAESMFDEVSYDVSLSDSAGFFRALLALHPDQVLEEYQQMPASDARGNDYRIQVNNEILPALVATTDGAFWNQLNNRSVLTIDKRIIGSRTLPKTP